MAEGIKFNERRDIGNLISATFVFVKQEFKPLLKAMIMITLPFILFLAGMTTIIQTSYIELFSDPESISNSSPFSFIQEMSITALFQYFIIYLMGIFVYAFIICYIKHYIENGTGPELILNMKAMLKYIPKLFISGVFYVLLVIVGIILLIIPGIYIAIALGFVFIVQILEDLSPVQAIDRSFKLIRGHWWATLAGLILVGLIQYAISFVFSMPGIVVYLIEYFETLHNTGTEPTMFGFIIMFITNLIASIAYVTTCLTVIYLVFQYHSIIEMKEAPSLLEKIENLGLGNAREEIK